MVNIRHLWPRKRLSTTGCEMALEEARNEETRANGLDVGLDSARNTCRERQEKIESLTAQLQAPKSLDGSAAAKTQIRAMEFETSHDTDKTDQWKRRIKDAQTETIRVARESEGLNSRLIPGDTVMMRSKIPNHPKSTNHPYRPRYSVSLNRVNPERGNVRWPKKTHNQKVFEFLS
jgi:hypothetical protein